MTTGDNFVDVAEAYKQLNAPLGQLGFASMRYANRSITDVGKANARYLAKIKDITEERDELAGRIKTVWQAAGRSQRLTPFNR